ncbi:CLUMA_CG008196, isoform A [Clunio marinus]|uniref:CLUMA_CG008196, isoform A n=1 Tax=Clunio marinus TaxID=568069 RepID=A0A1J1I310_9DIPT|nr:CLUMA_CG008196, isoform A [Clunio marinus]
MDANFELKKKKIRRILRKLNKEKQSRNVFDDARNDLAYRQHVKMVQNIEKKVDNDPPIISPIVFFPKHKFKSSQTEMEFRMRRNMNLVNAFNRIHRGRGKVDCHNTIPPRKNIEMQEKLATLEFIDKSNKVIANNLKKVQPTLDSNKRDLSKIWELIHRPAIIKSTKYPIVVDSLLTSDFDICLEDPPDVKEYEKLPKVYFVFADKNNHIGRINVMLYSKHQPEIVNQVIRLCRNRDTKNTFKSSLIYKIIKDLLIESDEINFENELYYDESSVINVHGEKQKQKRRHFGSIISSMKKGNSISFKFSISLKESETPEGSQIVIGRVVKGLDVLRALNSFGTSFGVPRKQIFIEDCGCF